jgi:hypothetical protein
MNESNYSHTDLVTAVFEKTVAEIDRNPGLAHLSHKSLLQLVAMVLTPSGVKTLIKECPQLKEQFARTVSHWQKKTDQITKTEQSP